LEIGLVQQVQEIVDRALAEDHAWSDVTTQALIPSDLQAKASIVAKASGVLAGTDVARTVFNKVDPSLRFDLLIPEGSQVKPGDGIAVVAGRGASILRGERVALNFLQRLSGIASETRRYVEAVKGCDARILDTRKTTPGLRILEKYAVRVGGGYNHRGHLGDGILVKDNHLAVLRSQGLGLRDTIARARENASHTLKVEVEVGTVDEALEAVEAGADIVMLDNMSVEEMSRVTGLVKGRALIEASGGVTLENVRSVAETGVDSISIGALTHSVKALDISLELEDSTP
jgi:nicotinate-nucleotide pyrophosphorylase (carboxylating)